MLWSDEYTRNASYLEKGLNVFMTGQFKQRFQNGPWEFKIERLVLLESIKSMMTKQLIIDLEARHLTEPFINFLDQNIKTNPGRSSLKLNIHDVKDGLKVTLYTLESGFALNDEMTQWLFENSALEVQVLTV
jgi:DNA polymerase-3 subunit alpha